MVSQDEQALNRETLDSTAFSECIRGQEYVVENFSDIGTNLCLIHSKSNNFKVRVKRTSTTRVQTAYLRVHKCFLLNSFLFATSQRYLQ
jgi:hypothetical protein